MKKIPLIAITAIFALALIGDVEARGGGVNRSEGGGRKASGGRPMSRSPSLSRSHTSRESAGRPGRGRNPAQRDYSRPRPAHRPSTPAQDVTPIGPGRPARPGRPVDTGNPVRPNRPVSPGASRPERPRPERPTVPSTPTPTLPVNPSRPTTPSRPERPERPERPVRPVTPARPTTPSRPGGGQQQRPGRDRYERNRNWGNKARTRIHHHYPDRKRWFDNDFWSRHHYTPYYYHHNIDWWRPATAFGLAAWLGWAASPTYVYYVDDGYYSDPAWYGTSSTVILQPSATVAAPAQELSEWMPIGVFALVKPQDLEVNPKFIFQLVLSKSGAVAGTFYNTATDETYPLEGAVDPDTQRIAWKIKDQPGSPILETGLYNLSEEETPVRINFANGTQQDMLLVRLDDD